MSVEINNLMNNYDKNKKNYKTTPKITKYERTRVLSERANQIDNGSAIFLTNQSRYENSYQIAMEEYNQGLIPFIRSLISSPESVSYSNNPFATI